MEYDENGNPIPGTEEAQPAEQPVEAAPASLPEEQPQEASQPEPETLQQEEDALATLVARLAGHEQRLAAVEQTAHTSHTIGQDVIEQIAALAVQMINARLKAALGQ